MPAFQEEGGLWPAFNRPAEFIYKETGWRGVVCGGAGDAPLADALCQESSAPLLNWTGRTSLSELLVVFHAAKLLLANETSAVHLSEAVKLPTVCILGGGHFGRFVPYTVEEDAKLPLMRTAIHKMDCFGCDWRCIYKVPADKPQPCIEGISVADVCQIIREILSNSSSYTAAATDPQFCGNG